VGLFSWEACQRRQLSASSLAHTLFSNHDDDESISAGDDACGGNSGTRSASCVHVSIM